MQPTTKHRLSAALQLARNTGQPVQRLRCAPDVLAAWCRTVGPHNCGTFAGLPIVADPDMSAGSIAVDGVLVWQLTYSAGTPTTHPPARAPRPRC